MAITSPQAIVRSSKWNKGAGDPRSQIQTHFQIAYEPVVRNAVVECKGPWGGVACKTDFTSQLNCANGYVHSGAGGRVVTCKP
eukprot:g66926.t1